jgi:hypothetical protein
MPSVKSYKNRDKVGFHFSCFLNWKIHTINDSSLANHNNISLKDKSAKPAFKTYITCYTPPPAPTHANIQHCLTKPSFSNFNTFFLHTDNVFLLLLMPLVTEKSVLLAAEIMSIGTATAHITSAKSCFEKQIFVLPSEVQFDGQG